MHAVEFLKDAAPAIPAVIALTGAERHFKQQAVARLRTLVIDDDESSLSRFAGRDSDLQSVTDELRTVSMWGDRRLVIVDDADDFVSKHRGQLERYVDTPAKKSVLVLDVGTWVKTTRLAKQVAAKGLEVACSELKGGVLFKWLQDTAADSYAVKLDRDAAALLVELIGEEPGMLDQELSKLGTYVGERKRISAEDVRSLVGGWRTETTWFMTDAVRDGHVGDALVALEQLFTAGEAPQKLLGGIGFVFRKLAAAVEQARHKPLDQALRDVGVFPQAQSPSQAYLRRLGRAKAERILSLLVSADFGLKGGDKLPDHVQMERLLLRLSGAAD
ncbi:MAG TPA: DNA polymerase III subunit delta [Planctomycetaceae bacterium]|nr:DNA polymerase III subunit delta [Planctomycetaceae bacterium]